MAKKWVKFVAGAGLSAVASYVWTLVPYNTTFKLASAYNPLAFLEHYHWGLASMVVAKHVKSAKPYKAYLDGFGVGMVAVEAVGANPFGAGKPPEQFIPSLAVGAGLLTALLL